MLNKRDMKNTRFSIGRRADRYAMVLAETDPKTLAVFHPASTSKCWTGALTAHFTGLSEIFETSFRKLSATSKYFQSLTKV